MTNSQLDNALEHFMNGGFVIVTDDESRENEGDLFILASKATTEKIGFMIRYTSGVICVAMTEQRSRELHLPLMVKQNQDTKRTAFTVTVDVKSGITSGISAQERANTIRALADKSARSEDFIRPGHIFPLVAVEGGLRERQGHTEAIIEMCRRTNSELVGAISELVNVDGSMMRGAELRKFAEQENIPLVTIAELLETMPEASDQTLRTKEKFLWAQLPRSGGEWQIATFLGSGGNDHILMKFGSLEKVDAPLVRIHSECLTGDVLGSLRCDCGDQLEKALSEIEDSGVGLLIYLRGHEGRGIGLAEKIRAYILQDQGLDTVDANLALGHEIDERDFHDAVEALRSLDISSVTLMTNNPEKVAALISEGIRTEWRKMPSELNQFNRSYLQTKSARMGHDLGVDKGTKESTRNRAQADGNRR